MENYIVNQRRNLWRKTALLSTEDAHIHTDKHALLHQKNRLRGGFWCFVMIVSLKTIAGN